MRFNLQDVKKSIHRRAGELSLSLHLLREGELHAEIERLIAYHERLLGQPQRNFSLEDARACVGDYRLAACLLATLSNWYMWRTREWAEVLPLLDDSLDLQDISSSTQLRLALYSFVNEHHQGFVDAAMRTEALKTFGAVYGLSMADLEYLLAMDTEEEALLVRVGDIPSAQEVANLYNQWAFEAALFNASSVRFVIDCAAFARSQGMGAGVGAVIKRLCFLARKLGVYYDLAYEVEPQQTLLGDAPILLSLMLYGPQEVTGAAQQYGLRLARLSRMLLGYAARGEQGKARKRQGSSLANALVEAEATVHFLQRTYSFPMDGPLLQLLPPLSVTEESGSVNGKHGSAQDEASTLFDSSIEQLFAEAFVASAGSRGVDGWGLEREPEPLLLDRGIFIPDFALTRGQRRIYVEILGFWTQTYRERKIQKLQQLQGRNDLLLAIPLEAKEAFASIVHAFPVVYYDGQLSVTDTLQVLRDRYDDFAERLTLIDVQAMQERVRREGIISEQRCYTLLGCYRRSELLLAAERVASKEIVFVPGAGLCTHDWLEECRNAFVAWSSARGAASLGEALQELREHWPQLAHYEETTLEALLGLWSEVSIRRDSIFEAVVELVGNNTSEQVGELDSSGEIQDIPLEKDKKKVKREKRNIPKKRVNVSHETIQGDLWG